MKKNIFTPKYGSNFKYLGVFLLSFIFALPAFAHQSPNTIILLDAGSKQLNIELQVPLSELGWAINIKFDENSKSKIENNKSLIKKYFLAHLNIYNSSHKLWQIEYKDMILEQGKKDIESIDLYQELKVFLVATPTNNQDARNFTFDYTGIMHQVATHITYVYLKNDWQAGNFEQDNLFGIIRTEIEDNKIRPLAFNLENGNTWKGFKGIFWLGVEHIKEGTDHLLFILTLLLPACLLVNNRKWAGYGGLKHSIFKLLKIVTAFTIGHSLTLLIGTFSVTQFSIQIIEILIAFSILITAIHAIKPLFYNKEIFIAVGFGFIHGLAFSQTLQNLHLTTTELLLSVVGFNIGIEVMQLLIILLIFPSFFIMSHTYYFKYIKNILAIFVVFISVGWLLERINNKTNFIVHTIEMVLAYKILAIVSLYFIAIFTYFLKDSRKLKL
jgi:hypothetical protein